MSVSKYIEEFNQRRSDRIQKNIEYSNANPYPIDELNEIKESDPESAISKLYGENGKISGSPSELVKFAAIQDATLDKKLSRGDKGLLKLEQNSELSKIDPETNLRNRYSAVVKRVQSTDLTFEELINSEDPDDILDDAGISGLDASAVTTQAAFKEIHSEPSKGTPSETAPINEPAAEADEEISAAPINDADDVEDVKDKESPLNTDENTAVEKAEDNSSVDSKSPTVDSTIGLNKTSKTETKSAEVTEPKRSHADQLLDDALADSSPVNDTINNITENTENFSNISEINNNESTNVDGDNITNNDNISSESSGLNINETSSVTNVDESSKSTSNVESTSSDVSINSSEESSTESNTTDENTSESSGGSFINVLNDLTIGAPIGTTAKLFEEDKNDSVVNESKDVEIGSEESEAQTSNLNAESESPVESTKDDIGISEGLSSVKSLAKSGETAVSKSKIALDDKVAPIHTPSNSSISPPSVPDVPVGGAIDVKEIKPDPITKEVASIAAKPAETPAAPNVSTLTSIDVSGLEARLRNIENILNGPLDVRIVD